jgi:hypothetical protein
MSLTRRQQHLKDEFTGRGSGSTSRRRCGWARRSRSSWRCSSYPPRATAQEILEVMEIASALGIHAVTAAAPILAELAGEVSQTR